MCLLSLSGPERIWVWLSSKIHPTSFHLLSLSQSSLYSQRSPVFSSVQSLSHVRRFATPRIAAWQASLSITNSQSLLTLMPIESVMPSRHFILCCPLFLLPLIPASIRVFSNESTLRMRWGGQSTGVSASVSVLPMNTQDWSPLGWTGWISLQSKGLSRAFSNTVVQKHPFFGTQLSSQSNSHMLKRPLEKPQPLPDGPLLAK